MPANNKYISNDTTLRYALSYFVCSVRTSNQAVRGRREKSGLPSFARTLSFMVAPWKA